MSSMFVTSDVMVLNDIINEAATGPPFVGTEPSSPPTVSAVVGTKSAHFPSTIPIPSFSKQQESKRSRKSSRKISMFEEDEGPNLKERMTDAAYRGIDIFCVWDCCSAYVKLSESCNESRTRLC